MKINIISKVEFFNLALNKTDEFSKKIKSPEAFIVKQFYSKEFVMGLRNRAFEWGQTEEDSWHPFYDNCPDYHRLHDNYPNAYVKQKFRGFYHLNYNKVNKEIFLNMKDIFELKNKLAGFQGEEFMNNIPSDGVLPRINVHHYPKGGGYQAEHIDPDGPFAQIQTLIVASSQGLDFKKGGLYAREKLGGEIFCLDSYTQPGDMIVLSPAIPHGIEPIDSELEYSPNSNDGRWIILPLFLYSDYPNEKNIKPKQI
jgi:hypothetical protein